MSKTTQMSSFEQIFVEDTETEMMLTSPHRSRDFMYMAATLIKNQIGVVAR